VLVWYERVCNAADTTRALEHGADEVDGTVHEVLVEQVRHPLLKIVTTGTVDSPSTTLRSTVTTTRRSQCAGTTVAPYSSST